MTTGLIPITDAQAKLGEEIVKALRGLGSFVKTALGSTPEDLVGYYLGGDRLHIRRGENIVRMLYEARARFADMGKKETQPAPLSLALPILQGAADEEREELVDLWARLLASAMDPATRNSVRHTFIAAVKEMDPPDAKIMHHIYCQKVMRIRIGGRASDSDSDSEKGQSIEIISQSLGYRRDDVLVSVEHLEALRFLNTAPNDRDRNIWFPSAKLREFMLTCYPELEAQV
jgi:hypothetical protein